MTLRLVPSNGIVSVPPFPRSLSGPLPALTAEQSGRVMEILRNTGGPADAFFFNFCTLTGMSPEEAAAPTVRRTNWRKSPSGDFNTTLARTNLLSYIIGRESVQGELAPDDPIFVTQGRPFRLDELMNRIRSACAAAGVPHGNPNPKNGKPGLRAVH